MTVSIGKEKALVLQKCLKRHNSDDILELSEVRNSEGSSVIATGIILVVSLVLFAYWFRYSCILILSAKPAWDYSSHIAERESLSFLDVHKRLHAMQTEALGHELDAIQSALQRDYNALMAMNRVDILANVGRYVESLMVRVDFQILRVWYFGIRLLWPGQGRIALAEMTEVVRYFANNVGENSCA